MADLRLVDLLSAVPVSSGKQRKSTLNSESLMQIVAHLVDGLLPREVVSTGATRGRARDCVA